MHLACACSLAQQGSLCSAQSPDWQRRNNSFSKKVMGKGFRFSKSKFQHEFVTPCIDKGQSLFLFMGFFYLFLSWGLLFSESLFHALQQKFYCFGGWPGSCGTFLTAWSMIHRGNFFQIIFAWSGFNELQRVWGYEHEWMAETFVWSPGEEPARSNFPEHPVWIL